MQNNVLVLSSISDERNPSSVKRKSSENIQVNTAGSSNIFTASLSLSDIRCEEKILSVSDLVDISRAHFLFECRENKIYGFTNYFFEYRTAVMCYWHVYSRSFVNKSRRISSPCTVFFSVTALNYHRTKLANFA